MKLRKDYPGLDEVLICIKLQAQESLDFAYDYLPSGRMSAEEIFYYLKNDFVYMLDPQGTELLQSMPSMFSSKNKHGIYGAGDCDCIVIATLACLEVKNFKQKGIVLAGRSRTTPVHIYNYVNGVPMDLTNEHFNKERKYPFRQWLPVSL